MVVSQIARGTAASRSIEIDDLRLVATVLLIMYHVIGGSKTVGLRLEEPSAYRHFAEYFSAVRMPLFAFIAGYVYALRPASLVHFRPFVSGKASRLLVPGAVALTVYLLLGAVALDRTPKIGELWRFFAYPHMHFWFLQAIFVILVVFAAADAALGGRREWLLLPGAVILYFWGMALLPNIFAAAQASYLLPFFLLGVMARRQRDWLARRRDCVVTVCVVAVALMTTAFVAEIAATGRAEIDSRSLYALAFGAASAMLLLLALPRIPGATAFSTFAFTIYLYHIVGTSLMRRVLHGAGVEDVGVNFWVGTAAGLAAPIAIHVLAVRWAPTRRLVLGILKPPALDRTRAVAFKTA